MFKIRISIPVFTLVFFLFSPFSALAAHVYWVDWQSGQAGTNGWASGVINIGSTTVNVSYLGEIAFIQTSSGTNYWTEYDPKPYTGSTLIDNSPPPPDIIALSKTTLKTLNFSVPLTNLFFAFVSLNGNGYNFDRDFEIVSCGKGYWGIGTVTEEYIGGSYPYRLKATSGEPHGVIQFPGPVSSISWTSMNNEYWNGFTVGTYGAVPAPTTLLLLGSGLVGLAGLRRKLRK